MSPDGSELEQLTESGLAVLTLSADETAGVEFLCAEETRGGWAFSESEYSADGVYVYFL